MEFQKTTFLKLRCLIWLFSLITRPPLPAVLFHWIVMKWKNLIILCLTLQKSWTAPWFQHIGCQACQLSNLCAVQIWYALHNILLVLLFSELLKLFWLKTIEAPAPTKEIKTVLEKNYDGDNLLTFILSFAGIGLTGEKSLMILGR